MLLALFALAPAAQADDARILSAEIVRGDGGYVLNADIDIELNPRLVDAVMRGVSLYFTTELRIERPRWYWLNEVVVDRSLDYRLSYHAITRSYRLSIGSLHHSFDNLDAAVRTMQRVRNWQIADTEQLAAGVSHDVELRFRLDTSQLPKPFQVTAIGSRDWSLGTDWATWTFLPGAAGQR
ncbi:hypothetical protein C666_15255 [Thauera linaloolentis 47Lol = DSM 12138]|uniref:Proline rich signal peptide protein n=1 Tax=Thauera linaloolentis (strain DSM 12138 / JCM 21573 / CCUG 41526 / CIP 105981 / IAM 15112 / NBRC 102519 / 47Lol) TaxID=1123367 RepID=N6Y1S6_THAL4|nr:hypothetical protein C666_15255 [Thauera linaloolentis 47Lol = DSM 12138]